MLIYVDMALDQKEKEFLTRGVPDQFRLCFQDELSSDDERLEVLQKADVILGNPPAQWLLQATNLKWIQLHSAGFEKYQGIQIPALVTNMHDYYSQPCAETMIAGILALYRKMDAFTLLKAERRWVGTPIRSQLELLHQKKVIILGTGNIGRRVAKILGGFDAEILFFGRTAAEAALKSKEELLSKIPWADIIIACLPGTPQTTGFFTREMIAKMQPGSLFCNVGRGNLLEDENALIHAIVSDKIGGAVLDVTAQEPIPPESKLWSCPNLILCQHSGGGQKREFEGIIELFLQNLQNFINDRPLKNRIDFIKGY